MKVTLRFAIDDPTAVQQRRWARSIEWPRALPLPHVGMLVVPAAGLAAREVVRVVYAPEGPAIVADFVIHGTHEDVEAQAHALVAAGFHEIKPSSTAP